MYQRKTRDVWDVMTNYGYGWEAETTCTTFSEAKEDAKAYRENTSANVYIRKRRERIEK